MTQGANYTSVFAGQITVADGPSLDAFSRLRVSNPSTIFDSKQIFDNAPLFWDDQQTAGGSTTSSHSVNLAATTMGVGLNTVGTRVRQTFRRFNYQPGKSQLIFLTGVLGTGASGITRRVGMFDESNGLFFELAGTTLSVVRRTKATGSIVDHPVASTAWNIDKLDGTGPSGATIQLDKTQIFVIDFEWLGVGRVRFGVVINGVVYYVHQMVHANILTTVYMSTPNLPLRYEISNDGSGAASSLIHICSTVITEGGSEEHGAVLTASTNNSTITLTSAGTLYGIIGLRLKTTHLGATVKTMMASFMGTSGADPWQWQLLLNPTVTGTFTYADVTNSACQVAIGTSFPTVTNGTLLNAGHLYQQSSQLADLTNAITLGSTIAGVSDTLVLCGMPVAGGSNVAAYASLTWRELL